MIDIREKNNKLEEFLKELNFKEELIAKTIIITKYLFGMKYRYEGERDKKAADALNIAAEGMLEFTKKYAKEFEISDVRVKEIQRGIYDRETTL
jgi:hypothetical protein